MWDSEAFANSLLFHPHVSRCDAWTHLICTKKVWAIGDILKVKLLCSERTGDLCKFTELTSGLGKLRRQHVCPQTTAPCGHHACWSPWGEADIRCRDQGVRPGEAKSVLRMEEGLRGRLDGTRSAWEMHAQRCAPACEGGERNGTAALSDSHSRLLSATGLVGLGGQRLQNLT